MMKSGGSVTPTWMLVFARGLIFLQGTIDQCPKHCQDWPMLAMLCSVVVYTAPVSHPQTPHFPPYHHQKFQKHKCLAKTQIKSRSPVKENTAANCKQQ